MSEERPTLPPGASRQSLGDLPEDEEKLVRASKLCETCRPIFDDSLPRHEETRFYDDVAPYKHHESYNTLCQSAAAGCRLCAILDEKWKRYAASQHEAPEGVSFTYSAAREGTTATAVIIEASYDKSYKRWSDILFRSQIMNFSDVKWQIEPRPSHSMDTVMDWVNKCLDDHQECQNARRHARLKPTRLLYLDPNQPDDIKLVEVTGKDDYQYVTLSHRWGFPEEPPKLSRFQDTPDQERKIFVETLKRGKPISDLPRTFQDTIHIVKSCGLKYLWIDSLCIFQDKDGEENRDWMKETSKMADIYAGGAFNIAATHGRNSDAGLFPVQPNMLLPVTHTIGGQTKIIWEHPEARFRERVESSELLSRGWVYQEVLYTPANLFCTTDEMWWSCSNTTCSDTFPGGALEVNEDGIPVHFTDDIRHRKRAIMPGNMHPDPMEAWRHMLEYYAETSVTKPSDRLVAIAGIANTFRALYPNQLRDTVYHSGIWLSKDPDCLRQLLWRSTDHFDIKKSPSHTYSAECNIPSWSPVSFKGLVRFGGPSQVNPLFPFEFVRLCSSSLDTPAITDEFGRASGQDRCVLHVRGILVNVTHVDRGRGYYDIACEATEPYAYVLAWWDSVDMATKLGTTTALIFGINESRGLPRKLEGLLLKPVNGSPSRKDRKFWERCGYISWVCNGDGLEKCWKSLGFERYGLTCDDNAVLKKDVSAELALEDVYIV